MLPSTLFYVIIGIILLDFIIEKILDFLNAKYFNAPIPKELEGIYDKEEYLKSQAYKKTNKGFGNLKSSISLATLLLFLFLDGFAFVDSLARDFSNNSIVVALIFFGLIGLAGDLLSIPFSYYHTFVIEEKFGFNKNTRKTFFLDKLKSIFLSGLIGGGLLALIVWFYQFSENYFWLYAWGLVGLFILIANFFYARLIVPIFNKQTPLEDGALRQKIKTYAQKVGFAIENIYVIDGSKRSTKANAYFSGFGREKRITLYDTLIADLGDEEIVAVLAHEVGHYKKKHTITNLFFSLLTTGFTLWLLSLCVGLPIFSTALGVATPSFHIGLVVFGLLYSPISEITGVLMNYFSRKFEYQADNFAKKTYSSAPLISALKKLSKKSLSNLTPHPAYVFMYYSHPTLNQRFKNLSHPA